jgi:hypothetical protein
MSKAENPREDSGRETTPKRFAETTPPTLYPSSEQGFPLLALMELQRSVGKLDEAVGTLKEQGKQQNDRLDKISKTIYAATAVLIVLGTILGFMVNKGVDLLIQLTSNH